MNVLTQNRKMKKSSQNGTALFNWTLPAFKALDGTITCPNAKNCIKGCYAKQGAYIWTNVKASHNEKLDLTKSSDFVPSIIKAIDTKLKNKKNKKIYIRIHDAGDFYNTVYTLRWFNIMLRYIKEPRIKFYAYTKQVTMFKSLEKLRPKNFTVIYSFGGKQDHLIDVNKDRHALVFETETELIKSGYINASTDDLLAIGPLRSIGLTYHGAKSFKNTHWSKV